jgi:hypothetical protein
VRAKSLEVEKVCPTCAVLFMGHPKRRWCLPCAEKRKQHSNRKSAQVSEDKRVFVDMSPERVDRIFAMALAEIRRTRAHRLDAPSFDYRNRYREP